MNAHVSARPPLVNCFVVFVALALVAGSGCRHHWQSDSATDLAQRQPLPVRVGFKHPIRAVNGLPANHPDGVVLDYEPNSRMPIVLSFTDPHVGELFGTIEISVNTPHTTGRIVWVDPVDTQIYRKVAENGYGEVTVTQIGPGEEPYRLVFLRLGNRE